MAMMPDGPVLSVQKHVGKNGKLFDCETPTPNLGGVKISYFIFALGNVSYCRRAYHHEFLN